MSTLRPIDQASWPRRGHFAHYRNAVPCTHAMTADVDVTEAVAALRRSGRRSYLAQTWALAMVVNRHPELRMALDESGAPAVWDDVAPCFTVFHRDTETFSALWTPFDPDFAAFHAAADRVLVDHGDDPALFPQGAPPPNVFDVSSIPWSPFTGFTLQVRDGWDHLLPIITLGRYRRREGRTLLPMAVQIHHAAADGFHSARLIEEFGALMADPSWIR